MRLCTFSQRKPERSFKMNRTNKAVHTALFATFIVFFCYACSLSVKKEEADLSDKEINQLLEDYRERIGRDDGMDSELCESIRTDSVNAMHVEMLIEGGANPNCVCVYASSAPRLGSRAPVVKHMMSRKSKSVTVITSPLGLAVMYNRLAIIEKLVELGADPNDAPLETETPMEIARSRSNEEAIKLMAGYEFDN